MSENDDQNYCGYIKDNGTPCQLTAGWGTSHVGSGKCRYHPGRGAPEGNDNAVDNDGGDGGPPGNFKAIKTGEHTPAERWDEFLQEEAPERFRDLYYGYTAALLDQGASPIAALRIARLWARADFNDMELIENEFETEHYHEGEFIGMRFDSDRDRAVIRSERGARLLRREEELSPYSQRSTASEVVIKGDSFDANISHERVPSDGDTEGDAE